MPATRKAVGRSSGEGVLVIVAGGNIGLMAIEENQNWVVRPAALEDLATLVVDEASGGAGRTTGGTLVLREDSTKGTRIRVDFQPIGTQAARSYGPEELDSAQVDPARWEEIAETIESQYDNYEGFVILHGLDTMAYTAAALSFMLGQPKVPVILTGAQRPLNFGRTDALQNIVSSIAIAASGSLGIHPIVQEVCVYSHDTLFRGNRVTMMSSSSYRSFDSPNYPALAVAGENIEIQDHLIWRYGKRHHLDHRDAARAQVEIVDVFPGMNPARVASLSEERVSDLRKQELEGKRSDLRGVLLRTYGMGTAPTSEKFLTALKDLVDAEIVVMSVTQARSGRISHGTDPVSVRLMEQGVVSGGDMTAEAAYAKMVVLLSQSDDAAEMADRLQIARCGEQSQNVFNLHFKAGETQQEGGSDFTAYLSQSEMVEGHELIPEDITHIQLRLFGVQPADSSRPNARRLIELKVNLAERLQDRNEIGELLVHETLRWDNGASETLNLVKDVTDFVEPYVLQPDQFMVRLETSEPISWTRAGLAIFSTVRLSTG